MPARPHRRTRRRISAVAASLIVAGAGLLTQHSPAASAPSPSAAAAAPAPDVLDIDFADGAAIDRAQALPATVYGAPTFGPSAKQNTTVMSVDGMDDAVAFPMEAEWPKLTSGFTFECVFRVDTTMPVSGEKDLCSDKEAGGASIYVNGANLGFMAHLGGGYKSVVTPIDGNRWYHAVATWDGSEVRLYVNGQLAGATSATGNLTFPAATSRRFVVGADAAPTGIGQIAPPSTYAASSVYSRPVSADEVTAMAAEWNTTLEVPEADVLDVDFADGTPTERTQGLPATIKGTPQIADDAALDRPVATFDGTDDAYSYPFADQWPKLATAFSIECTMRYTAPLPTGAEKDPCSNKEAGGFAIYVNGGSVGLMAHIGGGYKTATAPIATNQWYHVVGTWDGTAIKLYVNGELAATTPATGAVTLPNATARNWVLGADSSPNGGAQFYAPVKLANSRIYSTSLSAAEVDALRIDALGEFPDAGVVLNSSTPAVGEHLTRPVEFTVDVTNADNVTGWTYTLDGEPIEPGQRIGAGLDAGDHRIEITAVDVFGEPVDWQVDFTSDAIPTGDGTGSEQGEGKVSLSAIATSPDGSDVTTTFREATATSADGGFSGVVPKLPETLEFEYDEPGQVDGLQKPDDGETSASPTSGDIPFQRFDVEVPEATDGQQTVWSGLADPARSVSLLAWNAETLKWVELATARGATEGDTVLNAELPSAYSDGGTAHLMVAGIDPFADDLAPRDDSAMDDKDRFEEPADYDFSFAHFTDTQYLAEGAAGGTYDDWDGVQEPSDVQLAEERAIWAAAYEDTTSWIKNNADPRKIVYTAHTGDVIENDYYDPLATDANGNLLYPGLDEQVTREFQFTSGAQSTLDEAGVVNQVIAGNHDNQLGNEVGPASRFNQYYGPSRYYQASALWPEGTSYHAWDETTDDAGNTVTEGADNQNNYVLFSAGGLDFVAVGLSYGVTQMEADWASSVFARFPDRNGVLITHAYISPSGAPDGRGAGFSGDGSRLFDAVVADNPNVFLVLAGHEHGVGTNLKTGVGVTVSHNVVELLADYQFYKVAARELWPDQIDPNGNIDINGDGTVDHQGGDLLQFGASWLRLLQFDVDRSEMSIDTYSPLFDNFGATEYDDRARYNGAEDNLVLPVDLSTRTTTFETDALTVVTPTDTVIGDATARSGWPATVEWSGLTEGEVYAWVADSRTASGRQLGSINQFGTVFLATAAGTDVTPPEITVPEDTELALGDPFDPLAGVTATDNTDGDVTDRVEVVGTVDTERAGSYALTYVVADTNGNQVIVPRVVRVVAPVDDRIATTVSADNVTVTFGKRLALRAVVTPRTAKGTVQFLDGEEVLCEGPVLLGAARCTVGTLPPPGDYVVTAIYSGNEKYAPSQRSFALTVKEPRGRPRD
ncbi:MAG TPA: LamG-like jellyroll fold domain-containing protein [Nocardioides sp.]|nr:LamG-like jellyroll fold domain-containing protein [Nocardioides sp.]